MAKESRIQWTTHTWSPWLGCRRVSRECAHCYIEFSTPLRSRHIKHGAERRPMSENYWRQPERWNRSRDKFDPEALYACPLCGTEGPIGRTIFSCPCLTTFDSECGLARPRVFPSLCDPLDQEAPEAWRLRFWRLVVATPNLDWVVLTKRPQHFESEMALLVENGILSAKAWPRNVILGVSAGTQEAADVRVPLLLSQPCSRRLVSAEPLLEEVDFSGWIWQLPEPVCGNCPGDVECECGFRTARQNGRPSLDWLIVGGESTIVGRREDAAPCCLDYVDDIRRTCASADVPVFVKQLGSNPYASNVNRWDFPPHVIMLDPGISLSRDPGGTMKGAASARLIFKDRKGGDPNEWPIEFDVRKLPLPLN